MKEKGTGASSGKSGAMSPEAWKKVQADYRAYKRTERQLKAQGVKYFGVDIFRQLNDIDKYHQYSNYPLKGKSYIRKSKKKK